MTARHEQSLQSNKEKMIDDFFATWENKLFLCLHKFRGR